MVARVKRSSKLRLALSPEQLGFLRTGNTDDKDLWLDWHPDGDEVRAAYLAVRDDYPPGSFAWAESKFGRPAR